MSNEGLSVPTIKMNNEVVAILPNSYSFISGDGEVKVRAASTGGGAAVSTHTLDAETMVSVVKFSLLNTIDNMERVRDWKANFARNTHEAVQRGLDGKDIALAFRGMSVTNDPEIKAAADGVIEVELAGDKLDQ
ncbi:MAG: hypothetical protein KAS32_22575 [Candidatus Peribacteraceae bacterium]|nr:hypothetical protein [Candidatus Peribacteraceae bacterium]